MNNSNTTSNKTRELLSVLDNIENSYNPSSPSYRFTHVFYNIVDSPVQRPPTFPLDLWAKHFIPNSPLMPVLLNKEQIEERRRIQDDLHLKLTESRSGVLRRLESLRFKRELVRNKLQNAVLKFRERMRKYVYCSEEVAGVYRVQSETEEREKFVVGEKEEVLKHLVRMKERLERLEKRIGESIHTSERGMLLMRQLHE